MPFGNLAARLAVLVLLAAFGYEGVAGIVSGLSYTRAAALRAEGSRRRALTFWDDAAVGVNRLQALRETGTAYGVLWDREFAELGARHLGDALLDLAIEDFLECLRLAPGSAANWLGLARLYDRKELLLRMHREPLVAPYAPFEGVGRPGRIAIGLMRRATETMPNWYLYHDYLAGMYGRYGLADLAAGSVRDSAVALPILSRHAYGVLDSPELYRAFLEGSRAALGNTPFLRETDHRVAQARLERDLGELDAAEASLREVLTRKLHDTALAEARYNLGVVLSRKSEWAEAEPILLQAAEHERFRSPAMVALARIARESGDLPRAFDLLQQARRASPKDLPVALGFSRIARDLGRYPAAIEALRWACLTHPDEPQPYESLFFTYLEAEEWDEARKLLKKIENRRVAVDRDSLRRALMAGYEGSERR